MNNPKQILEWYVLSGATETIEETPYNRFKETKRSFILSSPNPVLFQNNDNALSQPCDNFLKSAINYAQQAQTLEQLKSALTSFDGCSLKKTATNLVFGEGNPSAPIMFVGEAPGADEDRTGRPFAGVSGQLLDKIMASIGLFRDKNVYITNIIPWRPPGNRSPSSLEISLCMPFVKRHIELVRPKILIMIGGVSMNALINQPSGIMKMRGNWITYQTENMSHAIPAMPILHTAFLLRNPIQKRLAWQDMLAIRKKMDELKIY